MQIAAQYRTIQARSEAKKQVEEEYAMMKMTAEVSGTRRPPSEGVKCAWEAGAAALAGWAMRAAGRPGETASLSGGEAVRACWKQHHCRWKRWRL